MCLSALSAADPGWPPVTPPPDRSQRFADDRSRPGDGEPNAAATNRPPCAHGSEGPLDRLRVVKATALALTAGKPAYPGEPAPQSADRSFAPASPVSPPDRQVASAPAALSDTGISNSSAAATEVKCIVRPFVGCTTISSVCAPHRPAAEPGIGRIECEDFLGTLRHRWSGPARSRCAGHETPTIPAPR